MSEQVEQAVNPGQAIYDALSDEAKASVDALPDSLFALEGGQVVARFLAESIRFVESLNASLWSIQCDTPTMGAESVALNVGGNNSVAALRDHVRVLVKSDFADSIDLDEVRATIAADQTYKDSSVVQLGFDRTALADDDLAAVRNVHLDAIQEIAELGYKVNHRWKWHRDDWRVKLAMLTGIDLPAPAYVPEDRVGLPMERADDPLSPPQSVTKRYWKISAGVSSREWPLFRDSSVVAMNWYDDPYDPTSLPEDKEKFVQILKNEVPSLTSSGARSLWDFRSEMSSGDEVFVYSEYELLGQGRVVGDYYFDREADDFRHRRQVVWDKTEPESTRHVNDVLQSKLSRRQTLIELSKKEYEEVVGREVNVRSDEVWPYGSNVGETLVNALRSSGLKYGTFQIASFYTALQTKGFVILSGISGTGKSKIAQRFAELTALQATDYPFEDGLEDSKAYRLELREYMKVHKRFTVPVRIGKGYSLPQQGESFDVTIRIGDVEEGARARVWNQTPHGFQVFLRKKAAEVFSQLDGPFFYLEIETDENSGSPEILAITSAPKPLHIVEHHETVGTAYRNHLFLPVRPDWRDGKALIGYHNPLSGEYVRTDFLDFVIAASDDYRAGNRNAFFVILDEMNLAHVEYYFADVLSVIESGRDDEGWTIEGIPLAVGEEDADLPDVLKLPPNLYIVGTVNMDETTHPFSPKVLDRAFTIELTEVDFSDYPASAPGGFDLSDDDRQALLNAFTQDGRYPRIDKGDIRAVVGDHPRFRDDLQSLNTSLRRSRMHFGYRVFDEIMQFVHNAERNGLFTTDEAFDHAVLMKVLPKFNGSRGKLHVALLDLIIWSRQDVLPTGQDRRDIEGKFDAYIETNKGFDALVRDSEDWRYPATGRRAALMMQDLYTDGFASFG